MRRRRPLTVPDFLAIGAQKAGSCWLNRNLNAHPEIWTPKLKELHYFDEKQDLGRRRLRDDLRGKATVHRRWRKQFRQRVRSYRRGFSLESLRWDVRFLLPRRLDDAWYASLFKLAGQKVKGETTPDYSALPPEKVARIHALMPEAKILFVMRNPIERAWSQALMFARKSGASREALLPHLEREHSVARSDYLRTLDTWGACYPEEQIYVGFVEDIHFHPEQVLSGVYSFLGVSELERAPYARQRVNENSAKAIPRDAVVRLADLYGDLIDGLDERFGGWASWWRYARDRLVEHTDEGGAPYPLYLTELWSDWLNETGTRGVPPLQSGPLGSLERPAAEAAR
jgi:hypothetical protein